MAVSERLLAVAIFGLLVSAMVAVVAKGPGEDLQSISPGPTQSSPEPTATFTFPGELPTPTESALFPTETETPAGPEISPGDELPRTGAGSVLWPAVMVLGLAAGAGVVIHRSTRRAER